MNSSSIFGKFNLQTEQVTKINNAFKDRKFSVVDKNQLCCDVDLHPDLTLHFGTGRHAYAFYVVCKNVLEKVKDDSNEVPSTKIIRVYAEYCEIYDPGIYPSYRTVSSIQGSDKVMTFTSDKSDLKGYLSRLGRDGFSTNADRKKSNKESPLVVIKVCVPVFDPIELKSSQGLVGLHGCIIDQRFLNMATSYSASTIINVSPRTHNMLMEALHAVLSIDINSAKRHNEIWRRQLSNWFKKVSEGSDLHQYLYMGNDPKTYRARVTCDLSPYSIIVRDPNQPIRIPLKASLIPHLHTGLLNYIFSNGYRLPHSKFRRLLSKPDGYHHDRFAAAVPALLMQHGITHSAIRDMSSKRQRELLIKHLDIKTQTESGVNTKEYDVLNKLKLADSGQSHAIAHFNNINKHLSTKPVSAQSASKSASATSDKKSGKKSKKKKKKNNSDSKSSNLTVVPANTPQHVAISIWEPCQSSNDAALNAASVAASTSFAQIDGILQHMKEEVNQKNSPFNKLPAKTRLSFLTGFVSMANFIVQALMSLLMLATGAKSEVYLRNGTVHELYGVYSGDHYVGSLTNIDNVALEAMGSDRRSLFLDGIYVPVMGDDSLTASQQEYWSATQVPTISLDTMSWPLDENGQPYSRDHLTDVDDEGNDICYRVFAPIEEVDVSCCNPRTQVFMDRPGGSVITSCKCSDVPVDDLHADRCLPDDHEGPTMCCMDLSGVMDMRLYDGYTSGMSELGHHLNMQTSHLLNQVNTHKIDVDADFDDLQLQFDNLGDDTTEQLGNLSASIILLIEVNAATKVSVATFNDTVESLNRRLNEAGDNHTSSAVDISDLTTSFESFVSQQSNVDSAQDVTATAQNDLISEQAELIDALNSTVISLTEQLASLVEWLGGDVESGSLAQSVELEILSPHLSDSISRKLEEIIPTVVAEFVTPAAFIADDISEEMWNTWECSNSGAESTGIWIDEGIPLPACTDTADSTYTWESTCNDSTWYAVSEQVDATEENLCPDPTETGIDIACIPTSSDVSCDECYVFGNSTCSADDTMPDNMWEQVMLPNGADSVTNTQCKCYAYCSNTTSDPLCDLERTRYDYGYRGVDVATNVTSGMRRITAEFAQDNGKFIIKENDKGVWSLGMWITSSFVTRCKTHDNVTCYYNKECSISHTELTGNLPLTCYSSEHPNVFATEVDTPRASVLRSMAQFDTEAPISSYKPSAQVALIAVVIVLSIIVIAGGVIAYIYLCRKRDGVHSRSELKAMTHEELLSHCKKLGVDCDATLSDSVLIGMIMECEKSTERYNNGKDKTMTCLSGARVLASRARTLARKACRKLTSKLKEMSDEDAKLMGSIDACSMSDPIEMRELLANRGASFVIDCINSAGGVGGTSLPQPIKNFLIDKLKLDTPNPIVDVSDWLDRNTTEGKNFYRRINGARNGKYWKAYMIPEGTLVKSLKGKGIKLPGVIDVQVGNESVPCDRITYLSHSMGDNGMTLPRQYSGKKYKKSAPAQLKIPKRTTGRGSMMAGSNKVTFLWSLVFAILGQLPEYDACDGNFAINTVVQSVTGSDDQVTIPTVSTLATIPSSGKCKYQSNTTFNINGVAQNVGINYVITTTGVTVDKDFDLEFVTGNFEWNTGEIFSCGFAISSNNAAHGGFCEVSGGGAKCVDGTGLIDYKDVSKLIKANGLHNNVDEHGALTEGSYVCKGVNAFSTQSPAWCVFGGCSELIGVASPVSDSLNQSRASVNKASGVESTRVFTNHVVEVVESGEVLVNVTCPITKTTTTCTDHIHNQTIKVTPQSFPDFSNTITDDSSNRWYVREDYTDGDTSKVRYGPWSDAVTCNEVPDIRAGSWEGLWDSSQNELGSCMDVTTYDYNSGTGEYTVPSITPMWSRIWDGSDANYAKMPVALGDWNCYASNLQRTCTTTDFTESFMATIEFPDLQVNWEAVQESGDFTISNCTIDGYSLSSANSSRIDCDCSGQGSARVTPVVADQSETEVTNIKFDRNTAECSDDKVKILFVSGPGNVDFWIHLQDQGRTTRSTRNTWTHVNGYLSNNMVDTNTSISNWTTSSVSIDGQHGSSNDFLEILIACICGVVLIVIIVVIVYCYCRPEAQMQRQMKSMQNMQMTSLVNSQTSRAFDGTMYRGGSSDPSKYQ